MGRSTVHYADSETNNILKRLHNKLRPAGTPVERVEYIIELLLLRIFEAKLKQEEVFAPLRKLFGGENYRLLFSHLLSLNGEQVLSELNKNIFPFYSGILSKARTVSTGNLPQKMQDQLVLMEEVFANSNFTNNVKGGVIAEVIGMVNEIDEKYILKTDLLGDAIESALSETGGTKDLGLYRTPDHVRRMMVEMVDPDFTDNIFDPTCGTAGFLFDAYDYVIEKARKTRKFPAEHVANMFYRNGIGGIEYQGRIRKMAAVNMYIRGLNPHNIEQGDSLKMFDPSRDGGSKSIVIANPPFGAERDQPAYPNVWEEYPKESETTILFVKLMFDLLNKKGRCAVIVSEGFLIWGQNSACALRKILLNEANLRAVISLPQGVFVSKSGQGAKTSVLYFEKDGVTDFVWYYKIENDGFSMGTNRKEITGSQIPELLKLFAQVRRGQKPADTKYSFCVSKEQIETLDPRVTERIRKDVTGKTEEKNAKKREKLVNDLEEKLNKKQISQEMYDEKLRQFDNIVEAQIDNEIAKAIERAHSYHFNLQNYRSNLRPEQIKDWQETLESVEIKNGSAIERRYKQLQKAEPKSALQILASFDPRDGLQMDIAREYLSKVDERILEKDKRLNKLEDILREGFQYPMVKLGDILGLAGKDKVANQDVPVLSVTMRNGLVDQSDKFNKRIASEDISGYKAVYKNQLVVGFPIDEGVLSFQQKYDIAAVSPAYDVWEIQEGLNINISYLEHVLRSGKARELYRSKMIGTAGRRRSIPKDIFLEIKVPLPTVNIQNEIVENIEKQKQIIDGALQIIKAERESKGIFFEKVDFEKVDLLSIAEITSGGTPLRSRPDYYDNGTIKWLKSGEVRQGEIYDSEEYITEKGLKNSSAKVFPVDTILLAMYGATAGQVGILKVEASTNQAIAGIIVNKDEVLPKYLYYFYQAQTNQFLKLAGGGGQPNISQDIIKKYQIPIPPLETQRQIVEKLDRQMQALDGVRLLKAEAEKRIEEILAGVWGKEIDD